VGFNACWGTFLLRRSIYMSGAQNREKKFLTEHAAFLADQVAVIQARNAGYERFMEEMGERLESWLAKADAPAVRVYLEDMADHLAKLVQDHHREMDMYGATRPEDHIARANRNAKRIRELCETPGPEAFPECYELIDEFNRLSWGHDEQTGMRFGMLTRAWAQDAARACAHVPAALPHAQEVRSAIRRALNGAVRW
jgi:hypothetical protein